MSHLAQYGSSPTDDQEDEHHQEQVPLDVAEAKTEHFLSWITTINGGGDPVTALAQRNQTTEASVAARRARVIQEVNESLLRL